MRPHRPERWTRRAVLAAGATSLAGAATGCGWFRSGPPEPDPPDPLEPLLTATRDLVDRYARTLARHPDLVSRLEPLHDTHARHVTALLEVIGRPELTPEPSPGGSASPPPGAIPSDPDEAIDELSSRERATLAGAREACLAAPVERVELLGSVCAARASHLEVLA